MDISAKRISAIGVSIMALLVMFVGMSVSKYSTSEQKASSLIDAKWGVVITPTASTIGSYSSNKLISNRIAPGTEGVFTVKVDASNVETGVDYVVTFTGESNKPQNLYFEVDGVKKNSLSEVATATSGHIDAGAASKVKTYEIKWVWPYETGSNATDIAANDVKDTADAGKTYEFTMNVVATQTNPGA